MLGSYKPDVFNSEKAIPILEIFKNNLMHYCDLILAETLSSIDEVKTIQRVFGDCKMPFWISLTIEDEYYNIPKLRSGEEIVTALRKIDFNKISSVLFNCSQPEFMAKALTVAKDVIPKNIKIGEKINMGAMVQKSDDYEQMESNIWKPYVLEQVKNGLHRGWALTKIINRGEISNKEVTHFTFNIPVEGAEWPPYFVENEFITKKLTDMMFNSRSTPYGGAELTLMMQKQSN